MEELFSCRNCLHNAGQTINVGRGKGYCLLHSSVIDAPGETTCKYLHRKDLPDFVVDESKREHAAEFAEFPQLVQLQSRKPIRRVPYSEKFAWDTGTFDPVMHALAQYKKVKPSWVLVQAFSGGRDGRRSVAHASLVRRYMNHCGTWVSSYRLVLAALQGIAEEPAFSPHDVAARPEAEEDALWDVVFVRLSLVQEYGWHSGLEELMWATDTVNGALSSFRWDLLQPELVAASSKWSQLLTEHAKREGVFFSTTPEDPIEDD